MFNVSRSEAYNWENASTGRVKRRTLPKVAALSIFGPRLETRNVPVEGRAPAIRVEMRPHGVQERREEKIALERAREQARARRERERLGEIKAAQARAYKMKKWILERAEEDEKQLKAALATGGAFAGFTGLAALYLGFQSLLESLGSLAAAVPGVAQEIFTGLIHFLVAGNVPVTIAVVLLSIPLLIAMRNAWVSGERVKQERGEFGY